MTTQAICGDTLHCMRTEHLFKTHGCPPLVTKVTNGTTLCTKTYLYEGRMFHVLAYAVELF